MGHCYNDRGLHLSDNSFSGFADGLKDVVWAIVEVRIRRTILWHAGGLKDLSWGIADVRKLFHF